MDNVSIHHVESAVQLIEKHGAILHFFTPLLPDLELIKEVFCLYIN